MDGQSRPAFEQGNGDPRPPPHQPYAMPQRSPISPEGGAPMNHYPQYSYDIQMRYEEQNRAYAQDPNRPAYPLDSPGHPQQQEQHQQHQQDIPRQYAQDPNPYAREIPSQYPPPSQYSPLPNHSPQGHGVQLPSLSQSTGIQAPAQGYAQPLELTMDTTGQIAPVGMKPRVTATLWEDEGSLCFQVDVKGTCVARREDNHMINGTKLLNVAGMTRGRRDGILKAEKQKHVVKIGPMHLKGVWIPYERALAFANKENITHMLYPIFVHNIGALLYHPINHARDAPRGAYPTSAERNWNQNEQHNVKSEHGLPYPTQQSQIQGGPTEAVLFNSAREHEPQPGR